MTHRGVLIGCGFFAENHMHGWAEIAGAEIVAVVPRQHLCPRLLVEI